jgi:LysR family transcriptional regulator (chromosome initiation inhibitor)
VRKVAALEAALMDELGRGAGPRPVRLAINADSLETWAVGAMAGVAGFRFDLVIGDQAHAVDLLRRGELSAAVTAAGDPVLGCDARPLGPMRYRAVCAPDFRARWLPKGHTPAALACAPVLRFDTKDGCRSAGRARRRAVR